MIEIANITNQGGGILLVVFTGVMDFFRKFHEKA